MSTSVTTQVPQSPVHKPIPGYIDITRAVDSFVIMGKAFSAYDVTKKLRVTLGTDYYISHNHIKDTIHSIMADFIKNGSYGKMLFSDEEENTFQLYYSQCHIPSTIDSFDSIPQVVLECTLENRFQVPANMINEILNVLYFVQNQDVIDNEPFNLVKVNNNYFLYPEASENIPSLFEENIISLYTLNADLRLRFKLKELTNRVVLTFVCYNNFPCIKIDLA
jgi:hypothetical protein